MKYIKFLLLISSLLAAQPAHAMQHINKWFSNQTQRFLGKSMQEWFTHVGVVRINQQSVKALSQQSVIALTKKQPNNLKLFANFAHSTNLQNSKGLYVSRALNGTQKKLQQKITKIEQKQAILSQKFYENKPVDVLQQNSILSYLVGIGSSFGLCDKWDYLSKEEKDKLAKPWIKKIKYHKNIRDDYLKGSSLEKNSIVYAIVESLKQGIKVDFDNIIGYNALSYQHVELICNSIVEDIKQGFPNPGLYYVYQDDEELQEELFPFIKNFLEREVSIVNLDSIYWHSNDHQKDFILEHLLNNAEKTENYKELHVFFSSSNKKQQYKILECITNTLEKEDNIDDLISFYCTSDYEQKDILVPTISKLLKKGVRINSLNLIYNKSNQQQKDILFSAIHKHLSEILHLEIDFESNTPTYGHLKENILNIYNAFACYAKPYPCAQQVLSTAIKSEIELNNKGYNTFYHAQIWSIYWLELLYTKLWQLKHKKTVENYFFTRFPENNDCYENASALFKEQQRRKNIMQDGRITAQDRQNLVFLNYAAYGNTTDFGSSSAHYFFTNSNVSKPAITSLNIFEKFKKADFYQKHQKEIDELEQEFNELSKFGNLIQLAVPEKHLNKHLYLTISGGKKKYAKIKKENTINTYRTNSIPEILTILKTNPEKIVDSDQKEFAWVATEDTIQKAMDDGVQIKSFNTADPEKFDAVMRKVDTLLEKLAQEDSQQPTPIFKSESTPWECYKMHKESFKKIDKNHL